MLSWQREWEKAPQLVDMSAWGTSQASGAPLGRKTLWGHWERGFCGPPPVSWPSWPPATGRSWMTWTLQPVPV